MRKGTTRSAINAAGVMVCALVALFTARSPLFAELAGSATKPRKEAGETWPVKYLKSAEIYDPGTGRFTPTGDMVVGPQAATATVLKNGRVLFAGGAGTETGIGISGELYDPRTATFTETGNLKTGRDLQTATLLGDGDVLIAGGDNVFAPPATAELYDPKTGRFSLAGTLITPRAQAAATLLHNGQVLIAGGWDPDNGADYMFSSAELYDPKTKQFTETGNMTQAVSDSTAIILSDGKVVIIGGRSGGYSAAPIELYNPDTRSFVAAGEMADSWSFDCNATYLQTGKILVTGCYGGSHAYLYDPANRQVTATGPMIEPRGFNSATRLPNGTVLVAGGTIFSGHRPYERTVATAELYDPRTGKFSRTGSMTTARSGHLAVLLHDGRVLIAGGGTD